MLTHITSRLRRFRSNEDGTILAETVLIFPLLFGALLATFVYFDAFRNKAINVKANYTIADAVSRESQIDRTFLINAWDLHRFLTNSPTLTQLRISLIEFNQDSDNPSDPGSFTVLWSRAMGGGVDYENVPSDIIGLTPTEIPIIPNNEVLIVVQTSVDYEPDFSVGLTAFTFENTTYTRPRGAPQGICFGDSADAFVGRLCPGDST